MHGKSGLLIIQCRQIVHRLLSIGDAEDGGILLSPLASDKRSYYILLLNERK